MSSPLLPRASLRDVVLRGAPLVGSRLGREAPRGFLSPVEARLLLGIPYGDLAAEEAAYLAGRTLLTDAGVVVRTAVAWALGPRKSTGRNANPWIVAARLNNLSIEESLERIFAAPLPTGARIVHFAHAHCLNIAYRDAALTRQLADADLTLPDGVGIRLAARLIGEPMRDNVNGTDLWPGMIRRAVQAGIPVALIGAAPGIADACAERLLQENPALQLPIVSHGFIDDEQSRAIAAQIGELGRCIVLVGMGTPLQEAWTWSYLAQLPGVTAVTVGGLFDFVSESVPRAPIGWRELGLEWVFRLIQEPNRLWRRYLVGNPLFLIRALRQRFRVGTNPAGP